MTSQFIIKEIQNRNQQVYKKLFGDLYRELVIYANGFLFDKASSEDMVQEVFIHLWEHAKDITIRDSIKSYLYAMVRNRCLNYLKSIKVNDSLHLLDFNNILDTSFDLDSLSSSDKQILHRQLQLVIEQLPKKMQQIVEMRFVNNYKYGEIAAELGVSVNTVKTQLQRAKLKISAALTQLILLLLHHLN
ncbi:RNA polymerase sigma factor [Imtechella halotolerans]|uniref:RNA polymerase ECF-type sigma factor n=1 Tax=Imtechella halotolerans K1 TaxID=946077 RepID=I0W7Q1_9FLAO|nr:RNA polymerase sigma-70 factor [Imtechella halotolerans]EID72417.1 RNA polymerase ECF-type sigma factor [Imtechella halotolerans K1]WMQ64518.1 RNA polymerase sigma-70 factor [Imtechella halotolerans]